MKWMRAGLVWAALALAGAVHAQAIDPTTGGMKVVIVGSSGTSDATAANQVITNTKLDTLHTDLTSSSTQLPTTIGQTTKAGSLSVTFPSDADTVTVNVGQVGGSNVTAGTVPTADTGLALTLGSDGGAYPAQWVGVGCGRNASASISTGLGNLVTCDAKAKLEVALGIDGSSTFLTSLSGHANDNVSGATALATGIYGACNDTTVATITEDNFTTARLDCGGHTLITRPFESRANSWSYATSSGITNTTTAVTVKTAAGSGIRNCVTGVDISADALGTATVFAIRDGAGGTVIWAHKIQTAGLAEFSKSFLSPICSSTNSLLEIVTLTASTTGTVFAQLQGFVQ